MRGGEKDMKRVYIDKKRETQGRERDSGRNYISSTRSAKNKESKKLIDRS